MRKFRWTWIIVAAFACLVMGTTVSAQDGQSYSTAQIEQFVAPVALYPDALLAQIFMASTYPGEVVDADQWTRHNPNLRGNYLASALDDQSWDVSVKSLVPFPNVLNRMADNQAWTQDLGNAFLIQPNDVMNAVQTLRHRAYTAGNLRTSNYQRVVMDQQYIQIVPVSTQTIYVPAYNPMVVYGSGWGYPTYYYPAMMAPPPYYQPGNMISFGMGFFVGAALFGAFDWNHHDVYYGQNFYQYPGYRTNVAYWQREHPGTRYDSHNYWKHDPGHRGPGGYNNKVLEERYGHPGPLPVAHNQGPGGHSPPHRGSNPPAGIHPQEPPAHPHQERPNQQPANHLEQPATHPQEPVIHPQQQRPDRQPAVHPQQQQANHAQQQEQQAAHPQRQMNPSQQQAAHPQQQKNPNQQQAAHPQHQKNPNQGSGSNESAKADEGKPAPPNETPKNSEKKVGEKN
jgi:hypothetical protein